VSENRDNKVSKLKRERRGERKREGHWLLIACATENRLLALSTSDTMITEWAIYTISCGKTLLLQLHSRTFGNVYAITLRACGMIDRVAKLHSEMLQSKLFEEFQASSGKASILGAFVLFCWLGLNA
jgi:hypothetical protein